MPAFARSCRFSIHMAIFGKRMEKIDMAAFSILSNQQSRFFINTVQLQSAWLRKPLIFRIKMQPQIGTSACRFSREHSKK